MIDVAAIPQAAVILPYRDGKILMQLRDDKDGIVYPGKWGFFSGSIEKGETARECARRELYEELGYEATELYELSVDLLPAPDEVVLHAFLAPIECVCSALTLYEGADFGLFYPDEILSQQLMSQRKGYYLPVIDNCYIATIVSKFLIFASDGNEKQNGTFLQTVRVTES